MKKELKQYVGEIMKGEVIQDTNNKWLVHFSRQNLEGLLPKEHVPYIRDVGPDVDVLVNGIQRTPTGYTLSLDRNIEFLLKLTQELPGVVDGEVAVLKAVRIPGDKSKIKVSGDPGTFIGKWGCFTNQLTERLRDKSMDVIGVTGNEKTEDLIMSALNIAVPMRVDVDEYHRHAIIYVPYSMIGMTLGRGRGNLRLAMDLLEYGITVQPLQNDFIYNQGFPNSVIRDLCNARLFTEDDLAALITDGKGKEYISRETYDYLKEIIEIQEEEDEYECPECHHSFLGVKSECPYCGVKLEFEEE